MSNKFFLLAVLGIAGYFLLPEVLLATTTGDYKAFNDEAIKIQGFLFGPAMKIAGVLGGAYGLIQAVVTSAMRPLFIWGGIGASVNLIPKFIDTFFVSGILLP